MKGIVVQDSDNIRNVQIKFRADIENIARTLINAFELNFKKEIPRLSQPLLRWLDFRLRFVDPKPRELVYSHKFPKLLPHNVRIAFLQFLDRVRKGGDINPYQGKGLIIRHDSSGKRKDQRTDLLWADWNILHFHLTAKALPQQHYFSERADWLLFAMVDSDIFACVDIRHHKDHQLFSDYELIKIVAKSWPKYFERFELKGIHAPETELNAEELTTLRKAGVAAPVTVNNKVYIGPGMGITTASTASRVTDAEINVLRYVDHLAAIVCEPSIGLLPGWDKFEALDKHLTLCITPHGLSIYNLESDKAWYLPKEPDENVFYLWYLNEILAPEWVVNRIFSGET